MTSDPHGCDTLLFGEVLFDHFPDGSAVLGGAPFNVAWGLSALGAEPLLVSRVGNDTRGERVRERMRDWGLSAEGLQTDPEAPTGEVRVAVDDRGQPTFTIPSGQAWDRIEAEEARRLLERHAPRILYHGSLALRAPASRHAWMELSRQRSARIFLDLNLRPPWWSPALVGELLEQATWIKLNGDELAEIVPGKEPREAARQLLDRGRAELVFVTVGSQGALAYSRDGTEHRTAPPRLDSPLVDTVGAGDAFSAATLLGLLRGWTTDSLLARAATLAAEICRHRGAAPNDPEVYRQLRQSWEDT